MVYEKLNGLKTSNISLSVLLSLSSQGAVGRESEVGLIIPGLEESVEAAYKEISRKRPVNDFYKLMKDEVLVDQMEWLATTVL